MTVVTVSFIAAALVICLGALTFVWIRTRSWEQPITLPVKQERSAVRPERLSPGAAIGADEMRHV